MTPYYVQHYLVHKAELRDLVKVSPTDSYRGETPIEYRIQGNPYSALSPSERRDIWGVGTVYGRTLTYPLRFQCPGRCVSRDAPAGVSIKETFIVRFEPVSCRRRLIM